MSGSIYLLHVEYNVIDQEPRTEIRLVAWFPSKPTWDDLAKFDISEQGQDEDGFWTSYVSNSGDKTFYLEALEAGQMSKLVDLYDVLPNTPKNRMMREIRMLEGSRLNSPYQEEKLRTLKAAVASMA
jgi:hypothetical protein